MKYIYEIYEKYGIHIWNIWKIRDKSSEKQPDSYGQLWYQPLFTDTLRKLYFQFHSHWMGSDLGNSSPFDFEPNGVPFGSKLKLSTWSHSIKSERK